VRLAAQLLETISESVMVHEGVRYKTLTPGKVTADLKKQTSYMASFYQPVLGRIRSGIKCRKINKYLVGVDYELHRDVADIRASGGKWDEEFNARWEAVLKGLIKAGYTLVAMPLSSDRIVGGDAAYQTAKKHGTVAVLMKE